MERVAAAASPLLASQPHTMHGHRQLLRHGMHALIHVLHVLLQDTPSRRPSRPTRAWDDAPEQRRGGGRTPAQSWDEDFDTPSRMDRASRCAGQARRCSATWGFDSGFWVRESASAHVCQGQWLTSKIAAADPAASQAACACKSVA